MLLASLLISGHDWLWLAVVLTAAVVAVVVWAYWKAPTPRSIQGACLALKVLGVLALFGCLLEPLWSGQRARPGANYLAILADNSQGMQIKDAGATVSRGEIEKQLLTTDRSPWQGKLEESFQVRRYLFDSRLQYSKGFGELAFDGRASSVGAALRTLGERYRSQPVAGILLFTDGNATDLASGVGSLAGLPPVYPVVIGTDAPIKDIALKKVTVTQTAFEDAPVAIQAEVTAAGFSGQEIVALLDELDQTTPGNTQSRAVVDGEQIQKAGNDENPMAFRFQVRPEKSGIRFYRLRVSARSEFEQWNDPKRSTEATLANNTRIIVVDRGRGPYRVLYVSAPNWEYKFLHRALDEDDQIQLSALIRIAKREPKMEFRGRAGESSNPLFRGFGNQSKEETERYDQAVIRPIAFNEEEFARLRGGFPKTPEELYRYHGIILDDLEADFFTRDQMALLQKFVSERGGGLLMLGGQESLGEGKFERTPIGEMLPVYLDRTPEVRSSAELRLNLTREGWLQPWARLRSNELAEQKRLDDTPPFGVLNQVRDVKPGASVIATATDGAGKVYPALVVNRFGNGRTAALMIGDLWHWGLKDKDTHRDMDKAWRQTVRWLVSDVPARIDIQAEPDLADPNQAVVMQVRVRDDKFQPLDNASVAVTVRPLSAPLAAADRNSTNALNTTKVSPSVRLTAEAIASDAGVYQATYVPRETGGYHAVIVVTNAVGAEVGRAESGWTSDPAAEEFQSLKPNRSLLEQIAKKTGGEVISADKLEAFAASLPDRRMPVMESWTLPLWHQPSVFLFALLCFVGEWGLRRWKGLA